MEKAGTLSLFLSGCSAHLSLLHEIEFLFKGWTALESVPRGTFEDRRKMGIFE